MKQLDVVVRPLAFVWDPYLDLTNATVYLFMVHGPPLTCTVISCTPHGHMQHTSRWRSLAGVSYEMTKRWQYTLKSKILSNHFTLVLLPLTSLLIWTRPLIFPSLLSVTIELWNCGFLFYSRSQLHIWNSYKLRRFFECFISESQKYISWIQYYHSCVL